MEEARRRDPVKRTYWGGGIFLALIVLWMAQIQFTLMRARSTLASQEAYWKQLEPGFLQVSNVTREAGLLQRNLDNLRSYATNRFLWTEPLNALQRAADDRVRVVSLIGSSTIKEEKAVSVSSNIFLMRPARRWWIFPAEPLRTNIQELAGRALQTMTNRADLIRFQPQLIAHLNVVTNPIQIAAQIEVTKPELMIEQVTLKIQARDYSQPASSRVDRFYSSLLETPFFKGAMGTNGQGTVNPDAIQAALDASDLISPNEPFIPFTVLCVFPDRIRSNE